MSGGSARRPACRSSRWWRTRPPGWRTAVPCRVTSPAGPTPAFTPKARSPASISPNLPAALGSPGGCATRSISTSSRTRSSPPWRCRPRPTGIPVSLPFYAPIVTESSTGAPGRPCRSGGCGMSSVGSTSTRCRARPSACSAGTTSRPFAPAPARRADRSERWTGSISTATATSSRSRPKRGASCIIRCATWSAPSPWWGAAPGRSNGSPRRWGRGIAVAAARPRRPPRGRPLPPPPLPGAWGSAPSGVQGQSPWPSLASDPKHRTRMPADTERRRDHQAVAAHQHRDEQARS